MYSTGHFNYEERLSFERRGRPTLRRLVISLLSLALFTLVWVVVPHNVLYWILLPVLAALIWTASHGWRWALSALHEAIHELEQMIDGGY